MPLRAGRTVVRGISVVRPIGYLGSIGGPWPFKRLDGCRQHRLGGKLDHIGGVTTSAWRDQGEHEEKRSTGGYKLTPHTITRALRGMSLYRPTGLSWRAVQGGAEVCQVIGELCTWPENVHPRHSCHEEGALPRWHVADWCNADRCQRPVCAPAKWHRRTHMPSVADASPANHEASEAQAEAAHGEADKASGGEPAACTRRRAPEGGWSHRSGTRSRQRKTRPLPGPVQNDSQQSYHQQI